MSAITVMLLAYDAVGNKIYETDGNSRRTDFYYDDLNRLIKKELPADEYLLPGDNNPTADCRPVVVYNYTELYFVKGKTVNEGQGEERKISYTYDRVGNILTVTDFRGKTIKNEYDDLYRLIKVTRPDGISKEYDYDKVGNKTKEIEIPEPGQRNTTHYIYNIYDQLKEVIEPGMTASTIYKYDKVGNKKEVVTPGDRRTTYDYTPEYWLKNKISYGENGKEYKTEYNYDKSKRQIYPTFTVDMFYEIISLKGGTYQWKIKENSGPNASRNLNQVVYQLLNGVKRIIYLSILSDIGLKNLKMRNKQNQKR